MKIMQQNLFFTYNKLSSLKKYCTAYKGPVYLYSLPVIKQQFLTLRRNLSKYFQIFYAQKSNPNITVLKFIAKLGAGCDTASMGEIAAALKAGFVPQKIIFTGPGKQTAEIEFALRNKILALSVESLQELVIVNTVAKRLAVKQKILVRINPPYGAGEEHKIIGGSGVSKFGIDLEQIPDFFALLKENTNVELCGIHIFNASQILAAQTIVNNIKKVIDTANNLINNYKCNFSIIDLGGGFGIPYNVNESSLDMVALGRKVHNLFAKQHYQAFLKNTNLIVEPGRFLSGLSGIYLTKVLYTKTSCGTAITVVDGGIHHLLRPALIGQSMPIINLTGWFEKRTNYTNYMIVGPLCTALDCFDAKALLCETKPGDILAVLNAGAYGYTESMPLFLSHPAAKEVVLK
jgi:diaminopimelate decarboxylase